MQRSSSEKRAGRRIGRLLWPAALAALAALAIVVVAWAHAAYDHSTPGQGEVVPASPARVDIFTVQDMQKVQGAEEITVERNDNANSGGQRVDAGDTTVDDANRKHFSVGLQPNLPAGRYVVSFKNVSDADGEADHGQFSFYVGTGSTSQQKNLDAALKTTSQTDEKKSSSHTGLIVGIAIGVAVVLAAIAVLAWLRMRSRPRI
jgi:methionine-rich copper-binding protein CopC